MKILTVIIPLIPIALAVVVAPRLAREMKAGIVAKPYNGIKSAESCDLGHKFLRILDTKAGLPEHNDWAKNKLTRYITSGSLGHSITIYGILDDNLQAEILLMAQQVMDHGNYGRLFIEFRDSERFIDSGDGSRERTGEHTLRSRVLTKSGQVSGGNSAALPASP